MSHRHNNLRPEAPVGIEPRDEGFALQGLRAKIFRVECKIAGPSDQYVHAAADGIGPMQNLGGVGLGVSPDVNVTLGPRVSGTQRPQRPHVAPSGTKPGLLGLCRPKRRRSLVPGDPARDKQSPPGRRSAQ